MKKQIKTTENQGSKQVDAIMNQNERQEVLIHKDGKNLSHKEIFEEIVRGRFDEIIELTNETNFNDLIYYFKGRKRFDDFENRITFFQKIKSGDIQLEEAKKTAKYV